MGQPDPELSCHLCSLWSSQHRSGAELKKNGRKRKKKKRDKLQIVVKKKEGEKKGW